MAVLVTGFEPFGGATHNASELIVSALEALEIPALVTAVLPTSYKRAEARIADLLRAHRPSTIFLLGLAESASYLRFEVEARNLTDCPAPDNDGEVRAGRPVVEGAPPDYASTLPLDRMAELAASHGEEVEWSQDAGGYVCNHVFFATAHLVANRYPGSRSGFVHLPWVERGEDRFRRYLDILQRWVAES